jgi:lysophospholipase L1-like esterase
MRQRAILAALTTVAATAATIAFTATSAQAAGANYAALGDSYSSGLGAGNYGSSGSCDRSSGAYGQLWANANSPSVFDFAACSGARTTDVVSTQAPTLSSSTTLVSITIGGNDVGFSSVMETCVLESTSSCVSAVNSAESQANSTLPGELDNALNAIAAHAPNARVVVLDYPELYDLSKSSTCIGLSTTDRVALNQAADILDGQIQAAAARHGDVFADVRSAFSGHEICDGSSWLHSVDWLNISDSYHPTASGQSGAYYPVFSAHA